MQPNLTPPRALRSALYIDFDNIFINLEEQDRNLAQQFASYPDRWLRWLQEFLPAPYPAGVDSWRRILLRRCYLNPQSFASYRPYFIRSGFEVIDCPPLTGRGKTSTDVNMVIDIMDTLHQGLPIDEFILLSGDADFTPVLLRLRRHDRLTAMLSTGYLSPAYKAACDYVISSDVFIKDAMGYIEQDYETPAPLIKDVDANKKDLLGRIGARLIKEASQPDGIEASELPSIYRDFPEFASGSNWLGYFSLRRLTEAVIKASNNDLEILEEDPWRVIPKRSTVQPAEETANHRNNQKPTAVSQPVDDGFLRNAAEYIANIVQRSASPLPLASVAWALQQRFKEKLGDTQWMGFGSFKNLLIKLDLGNLKISNETPGYLYDPSRHDAPKAGQYTADPAALELRTQSLDNFSAKYPNLAPLAAKVHQLTETPYLMPEHYALLLQEIAREVNENGYQLTRTSKTVRDRCVERGAPVARSHVNFVLFGLAYAGHRLGENEQEDPMALGEALVRNTLSLCSSAQFNPDEQEKALLDKWILGGLTGEADLS